MRVLSEERYQALLNGANSTVSDKAQENPSITTMNKQEEKEATPPDVPPDVPPDPVTTPEVTPDTVPAKMTIENILSKIPKTWKVKAAKLLKKISESPDNILDWDEQGRIIYQGALIPNTNISYLLKDVVSPYKNFTPIGADKFRLALSNMNIGFKSKRLPPPPGIRPRKKSKNPVKAKIISKDNGNWQRLF